MLIFLKKLFSWFANLSFKKKTVLVVIITLILSLGFYAQQYFAQRNGYLMEKVHKASITEIVSESGEILSDGKTIVNSPANGNIEEIYVQNGEMVKTGQDLFKVKSSATEQEKQTAYASYLTAKATYDADNAELFSLQAEMFDAWKTYTDIATNSTYQNSDGSPNPSNRILTGFTIAQDDWYAAEANYKNQQTVLAKDKAALESARIAYQATQTSIIKAPIDGVVNNLSVTTGNSVTTQTLLNPTPKSVLIIASDKTVEAMIPVGQTNITKIKLGQTAIIRPDAYKDVEYKGTITRIDSIGTNSLGVVTYNAYIAINNPDENLRAGMTLDGDIITNQLDNVLSVPNSAVVLNQGKRSVRILKNNKIVFLPVIIGIKSDKRTQIIEGLSEGQEIIVSLTNKQVQRTSNFFGL